MSSAAGETISSIALRFRRSVSWCQRSQQEFCEQGQTAPSNTQKRTLHYADQPDRIRSLVSQLPDITFAERQTAFPNRWGLSTRLNARALLEKRHPRGRAGWA